MMKSIYILKCGTQSPVGTHSGMTAASARAGISRFCTHPSYEDRDWLPVKVAMAGYLEPAMTAVDRMTAMGAAALGEVLQVLEKSGCEAGRVPLLVGLPSERPGLDRQLQPALETGFSSIRPDSALLLEPVFFPFDNASGLIALKEAARQLQNGEAEFCIGGGVDSFISTGTLTWLEEKGLLRCESNRWGLIPGEAAGFCLLSSRETAEKYQLNPLAELLAIGESDAFREDGEICTGRELTFAVERTFEYLPEGDKIAELFCDANGQRQRVSELGYLFQRLGGRFTDINRVVAPADIWGDLGAASGPLLISLVTEAGRKGYSRGPYNMITAVSDMGKKAAALVHLDNSLPAW